jgi:hypothetical protein
MQIRLLCTPAVRHQRDYTKHTESALGSACLLSGVHAS